MKKRITSLLILVSIMKGYTQDNPDYLLWSSTNKLTVQDFSIKTNNSKSGLSFAQFTMDYSVSGFDFLRKDFNQKVKNSIIKSASYIDTTQSVKLSLRYQQTLFDLAEIYARRFRKELRENRKQLAKGMQIVHEINSQISADFAKRRIEYDSATNSGSNDEAQILWEQIIDKELVELSDYEYEE